MAQLDDIKGAMTRKFGPLPAWGWAGIAGGGIYWYRQHTGAGASSADSTQAPAYVGPYGQDPYPIQGGAGIAGGGGGDTGATSDGAPIGDMVDHLNPGSPAPVINVQAPPNNGGRPRAQKPKKQHTKQDKGPWVKDTGKRLIGGGKGKRGGSHNQSSGARGHQGGKNGFSSTVTPVRPPRTQAKPPAKHPSGGAAVAPARATTKPTAGRAAPAAKAAAKPAAKRKVARR